MKLAEIAEQIAAHLKRFEADPKIARSQNTEGPRLNFYCETSVRSSGPRVFVTYVSYHGAFSLTKAEAEAYLAWLDAGNVGRHWDQQREAKEQSK